MHQCSSAVMDAPSWLPFSRGYFNEETLWSLLDAVWSWLQIAFPRHLYEGMSLKTIHTGTAAKFRVLQSLKNTFFISICHPTQSTSPELGGEVLWV